jgi:hypothetical protein
MPKGGSIGVREKPENFFAAIKCVGTSHTRPKLPTKLKFLYEIQT